MVVNILSSIQIGFALKKCCAILGTCLYFAMKKARDNLTLGRSKGFAWDISYSS